MNEGDRKHKHKGVVRSDTGALRMHPLSMKHRDKKTEMFHNLEKAQHKRWAGETKVEPKAKPKVESKAKSKGKKPGLLKNIAKVFFKKDVMVPVDSEDYIHLNLTGTDMSKFKGVRIKFVRTEGRTKRTVGLQIER